MHFEKNILEDPSVIFKSGEQYAVYISNPCLRNTQSKEFSVANTRSRNFGSRNFGSNGILGRREFSVEEFWVEGNFGSNKNYQEILRNQSLVVLMIK